MNMNSFQLLHWHQSSSLDSKLPCNRQLKIVFFFAGSSTELPRFCIKTKCQAWPRSKTTQFFRGRSIFLNKLNTAIIRNHKPFFRVVTSAENSQVFIYFPRFLKRHEAAHHVTIHHSCSTAVASAAACALLSFGDASFRHVQPARAAFLGSMCLICVISAEQGAKDRATVPLHPQRRYNQAITLLFACFQVLSSDEQCVSAADGDSVM
jgi:hypothetical protein